MTWAEARTASLTALTFPFPAYRPGQRALAGEIYRACIAGRSGQKTAPGYSVRPPPASARP